MGVDRKEERRSEGGLTFYLRTPLGTKEEGCRQSDYVRSGIEDEWKGAATCAQVICTDDPIGEACEFDRGRCYVCGETMVSCVP